MKTFSEFMVESRKYKHSGDDSYKSMHDPETGVTFTSFKGDNNTHHVSFDADESKSPKERRKNALRAREMGKEFIRRHPKGSTIEISPNSEKLRRIYAKHGFSNTRPFMKLQREAKLFSEFIEEARRMKVLRTAHYTSRSNKENILRSGFKDSPSTGTYHPDNRKDVVYTTPSSRVGSDYGGSRVNLRLVNPKVKNTDSPKDFGKNIKKWMASASDEDLAAGKGKPTSSVDQARSAFKGGARIVRVPNAHGGFTPREGQSQGSYVMVDKETANKSIDRNPQPTMKAKSKKRRTQTQPKRK